MKLSLGMSILFLSFLTSSSSAAKTDIEQNLDSLLRQAQSKELTYLPTYITERRANCAAYGETKDECLLKLQKHAMEVLSCPQSEKRFQEGIDHDVWLANETFLQNERAVIPQSIVDQFNKLVQAVRAENGKPFRFKYQLDAYKSKVKNAHAAVGGQIYLSEGLWTGEDSLTIPEVAAIMAHEIAHVIHLHGMHLNCMAIEWTSSDFNVQDAQATFQEDFRGSTRFDRWSQFSQKIEFQADATATRILKSAGLDPDLMVKALEKMKPKSEGGFSSGSHPEFEVRLRSAQRAADQHK